MVRIIKVIITIKAVAVRYGRVHINCKEPSAYGYGNYGDLRGIPLRSSPLLNLMQI